MNDILHTFIATSQRALVIGNVKEMKIQYCNQQMTDLYGVNLATSQSFMEIFQEKNRVLKKILVKQIKKKESSFFYDIMTRKVDGTLQLADLQVGYVNRENSVMFMEITPKEDTRMEIAMLQVNQSNRAEGILNFDEKLSLVHCNDLFHEVFESDETVRHSHYGNDFSNGFQPEIREELLKQIHEKLNKSDDFMTKMKVITSKGHTVWYSLALYRRTLDNSGIDKIMAYLTNIENQVKTQEQLNDITQYFNILQGLSQGLLYRFDIQSRTLYRSSETASNYSLSEKSENFPSQAWLDHCIPPEEQEDFIAFVEKVCTGVETVHDAKFRLGTEKFQHHHFNFKPLFNRDGTVKEMVGSAMNINHLKETESQLEMVNRYFSAMQELTDDFIYRVDVETMTLYHTHEGSRLQPYKLGMPDHLNTLVNEKIVHPDDVERYVKEVTEWYEEKRDVITARFVLDGDDYKWYSIRSKKLYDSEGNFKEIFGRMKDIQLEKELELKATQDLLTEVYNKTSFAENVSAYLAHSEEGQQHALFFVDLDDFKGVNDTYGHIFGDVLLSTVGKRLKHSIKDIDFVGRLGGDEFAVFIKNIYSEQSLLERGDALLESLHRQFGFEGHSLHIKASIGVALFPQHGKKYQELLKCSDIALYQSKGAGKNVVSVYSSEMKDSEN